MTAISTQQREALKSLAKGAPIEAARAWLLQAHINEPASGVGWPHLKSQKLVSVWGGTLDGVIGLTHTGVDKYAPVVSGSVEWVLAQQRSDGGFGSREMGYSSAESTAWVVLMLREIGFDIANDARSNAAIAFLESCVSPTGWVGTAPGEQARVYPTLLTLMALHGYSDKAKTVAAALISLRDSATGGWGMKPGLAAIPSKTAQVVYALLSTDSIPREDTIIRDALSYVLSLQNADGDWPNARETWYCSAQPNIPLTCHDHTISWALRALVAGGYEIKTPAIVRATEKLVRTQTNGSWEFDSLEKEEHVWCVVGATCALASVRKALLEQIFDFATAGDGHSSKWSAQNALGTIWSALRANFQSLLVGALTVYVFRDSLRQAGVWVFGNFLTFLNSQGLSIVANLLSTALWVGAAAVVALVVRKASKPKPARINGRL